MLLTFPKQNDYHMVSSSLPSFYDVTKSSINAAVLRGKSYFEARLINCIKKKLFAVIVVVEK